MPRQEQVLTVLVASPSDVSDERGRLEELIREHNITWSREFGIRLELVRWETHAYPGVAVDPQAVINEQLPQDYDIFIGLMWCEFGTATGRAGSGTIEEFGRAKARFDSDPSSVSLMMYFKDAPIPPSRIKPDHLANIAAFRESLGDEGVLYWKFSDAKEFDEFVRLHLARQVQSWRKRLSTESCPADVVVTPAKASSETGNKEDADEELGAIELAEILEERIAKVGNITGRINAATEEVGLVIRQRSEEMDALPRDAQGHVNRNALKRILQKTAGDMDTYSTRLEAELPMFSENLSVGLDALARAASLSVDFVSDDGRRREAIEAFEGIANLRRIIRSTAGSVSEFRDTVSALPRLTGELNRAKRRMARLLDGIVVEIEGGDKLLREAETVMRELLDERAPSRPDA